jgi:hypothetical protein
MRIIQEYITNLSFDIIFFCRNSLINCFAQMIANKMSTKMVSYIQINTPNPSPRSDFQCSVRVNIIHSPTDSRKVE